MHGQYRKYLVSLSTITPNELQAERGYKCKGLIDTLDNIQTRNLCSMTTTDNQKASNASLITQLPGLLSRMDLHETPVDFPSPSLTQPR